MFYDDDLLHEAGDFAEHEWDAVCSDMADLIAIDSAKGDPVPEANAPYGAGPRKVLDAVLAKAQGYGLDVHDCDGHIGYGDLPGTGVPCGGAGTDGRRQLAVIGHVDVVPAGDGWTSDPFALTERDGCLVGRGVSDDKGPLTCALHAVRFWIERNRRTGTAFPHDLRILFGCDEESGMSDADWYLSHYAAPDFLFTPDAEFPVCYGEKGQLQFWLESKPIAGGMLRSFEGGQAFNAVPGTAQAEVLAPSGALHPTERVAVEELPDAQGAQSDGRVLVRVSAKGIAGHASIPEGTLSAVGVLADYLLQADVCTAAEGEWLELAGDLAAQNDGALLGIAASDRHFGPLTCVASMARLVPAPDAFPDSGALVFRQALDCRFPSTDTASGLLQKVRDALAGRGVSVKPVTLVDPLLVDPDTAPVQALRRAYTLASGRDAEPVTMGGGTYAHHFPVGVSFGAADVERFPRPAWAGDMHAVDEAVPIGELKQALVAYIVAIGLLMDGDLRDDC